MSDHKQFIEDAQKQLDTLGADLDNLDGQLKSAGSKADAWCTSQMQQLRSQLADAKAHVDKVAMDAQSQATVVIDQAKEDTERHWKALQAAVKTYREVVDRTVPKS